MTTASRNNALSTVRTPRSAVGLLLLFAAVAIAFTAGHIGPYPSLLRGWLFGFAIWSCDPIGAMTLLLIHRLTGGRWGYAIAPVLRPLAAMMPLVAIAFVPVLTGLRSVYPWAADPGQTTRSSARLPTASAASRTPPTPADASPP